MDSPSKRCKKGSLPESTKARKCRGREAREQEGGTVSFLAAWYILPEETVAGRQRYQLRREVIRTLTRTEVEVRCPGALQSSALQAESESRWRCRRDVRRQSEQSRESSAPPPLSRRRSSHLRPSPLAPGLSGPCAGAVLCFR